MKIVIIGAGYASICFVEHYRKINQSNDQIIVYSKEKYCNRPQLFFRYKFLNKPQEQIDMYQDYQKMEHFFKEHQVEWYTDCSVEKIDIYTKQIILSSKQMIPYDICIMATGSIPQFIPIPKQLIPKESQEEWILEWKSMIHQFDMPHYSSLVQNYLSDYLNHFLLHQIMVIRNVEEIELLFQWMRFIFLQKKQQKWKRGDIVVMGSGALSIDFVSSLMDGYGMLGMQKESEFSASFTKEEEYLPHVTILVREESKFGYGLLQDVEACQFLLHRINNDPIYSKFLHLETNYKQICSINYVQSEDMNIVQHVTIVDANNEQKIIPCTVFVEAIGVKPNLQLVLQEDANIKIGSQQGIVVNSKFQVVTQKENQPIDSLYCVGDATELDASIVGGSFEGMSYNWRNWTSVREQAQECAQCVSNAEYKARKLWFNQTLRMFGFYVACFGMYHLSQSSNNDDNNSLLVIKHTNQLQELQKIVLQKSGENKYKLIGALCITLQSKEFMKWNSILQVIKLEKNIPKSIVEQLQQQTQPFQFDFAALFSTLNRPEEEEEEDMNEKSLLEQFNKLKLSNATPKKFVNPLLAKKKK